MMQKGRLNWINRDFFYSLGFGLYLICIGGCGSQPQPKIDTQFKIELADILIQAEAYDEAMPIVQKNLRLYPKDERLHELLGIVLREKGVYEEAQRVFKQAIKLNPKRPSTYTNLGILYSLIRQHTQAIALHKKAIELNPKQAQFYNNLGFSSYLNQDYKTAIDAYQNALRLAPQRKQLFINLALTYGALKKDQKAIRLLKETLSSPEVLNTLGVIKERRGELKQALALYEEAFNQNPKLKQAHYNLLALQKRMQSMTLDKKD